MWPPCREQRVAAITYNGIENVDLSPYSRRVHPSGWNKIKGPAAKGSLSFFAWDVRGGDVIYVADSVGKEIIAMGYARAPIGRLAYRFDAASPIVDSHGMRWCHLIDMDWDRTFVPFIYTNPRAAQHTVLSLNQNEIENFERASQEREHRQRGLTEEETANTLLLETAYSRYTPAALRLIRCEHVALSNRFTGWLQNAFGVTAVQERQQIDATFKHNGKKFLVEFKIAYLGDTKRAIREALGQILEYNHYPQRVSHDHWLLILNTEPDKNDKVFLNRLREAFGLPLTLGWQIGSAFIFEPFLSL
jgi:hypothetical protein